LMVAMDNAASRYRHRLGLIAPVTSVFRSTIGSASQTSSVAADASILAYRRVVETAAAVQRVTFSQADS
jgi:hypothetical protein